MQYKLYTKSKRAWDAILSEIEKATKSIYMEMYIFDPDTKESHDFLGILKRKSQQGVKVIIVADSFGSGELKKESKDLEKSGIELIFFSNWLRHIHRKIFIIDEKTAFIGGVNIGKRFANWNDLQLKLHGKKLIKRILKSFAYTYAMAGGKDANILDLRKQKLSYKLKFWLVEHWPQRNVHTLRRSYEEKITGAKRNIRIITPYFAPPRWLISLLDIAAKRGIDIEILIPRKSDIFLLDRINLCYMENMKSLGIKFLLMGEMNHSKLLIIDDEEALIGSQNLDLVSFELNTEAGIFFKDIGLIKKLLKTVEMWKEDSILFESQKNKTRIIDYLIILLMKIFRPIL